MADQKVDRRITRTKRMIRDAFTQLLEEKGFEGITVRDITGKADINRGTFYLHYDSKYDLLEKSETEILAEMSGILKKINPNIIIHSQAHNEPIPFLVTLFEMIKKNSEFMTVILGSKGNPLFQVKLKNFIKDNFLSNILPQVIKQSKNDPFLVPLDYLMAYISSAHLGVIQQWLESKMQQTPREMALILSNITFYGPAHIVGIRKD
ncbi:TetR/AcrR family transcriptional regulator [Filibacter tadaridae]|uniref:DNA-binding transcriptional regulator EnvR n=1 Tax=Filibacter tadaridae TaxID=2483811 RepID=A0A3P5XSY7_9BACL|nr:TetR/AcrR family transcriptional regulator [Filibacter tadaridae]VDC32114.1 DNA-binding transcriptional regulator EnvR [Filibacter tadaridae]